MLKPRIRLKSPTAIQGRSLALLAVDQHRRGKGRGFQAPNLEDQGRAKGRGRAVGRGSGVLKILIVAIPTTMCIPPNREDISLVHYNSRKSGGERNI
jgi:hypothetical protein